MTNGFDTQDRKRSRKGGASSAVSREVYFASVEPTLTEREREVLNAVKSAHSHGATPKEVARAFGVDHNVVSGRFKRLRDLHKVVRLTGEKREDSRVYVAVRVDERGQGLMFGEAA